MLEILSLIQVSDQDIALRSKAFTQAAYRWADGRVDPLFAEEGEPSILPFDNGYRKYRFRFSRVTVSQMTGKIRSYTFTPPSDWSSTNAATRENQTRLNDAVFKDLARAFFRLAGNAGEIKITSVVDPYIGAEDQVQVNYIPTYEGVPYEGFHDDMTFNRVTGQLQSFYGPTELPVPPPVLTPGGTRVQAQQLGLRLGAMLQGSAVQESSVTPIHLSLWVPAGVPITPAGTRRTKDRIISLSTDQVRSLQNGQALLAYSGQYVRADGDTFYLHFDALMGNLLDMQTFDLTGMVGGIDDVNKRVIHVPTGVRSWRLSTGSKGWHVWSAPVRGSLTKTSAPPSGKEIPTTLTNGTVSYPARYLPSKGLLKVLDGWYRPTGALATALKKLK